MGSRRINKEKHGCNNVTLQGANQRDVVQLTTFIWLCNLCIIRARERERETQNFGYVGEQDREFFDTRSLCVCDASRCLEPVIYDL